MISGRLRRCWSLTALPTETNATTSCEPSGWGMIPALTTEMSGLPDLRIVTTSMRPVSVASLARTGSRLTVAMMMSFYCR